SLAVLAASFGPFWYAAAVATAQGFAYRFSLADRLLGPHVAIVQAEWYGPVMVAGISVGLTYVFFLWWWPKGDRMNLLTILGGRRRHPCCGFCGRQWEEVGRLLVEGKKNAFICDSCID